MKTRIAFAALALVLAPAAALAEPGVLLQPNGRSAVASSAGLDLTKEADAQAMAQRIHAAASRVCRPQNRAVLSREIALCREAAVARALATLRAPLVTAAVEHRRGARLG